MEPTEKDIEDVRAKIAPRELHSLEVEDDLEPFVLLVSSPTKAEWMKYLSDLTSTQDLGKKTLAHENFLLAVTHWPDREGVRSFINRKFGVLTQLTDQLGEIVGAGAKIRSKKL